MGAGFGSEGATPKLTGPRCARVHGFSVHANTQIPAHRREQWADGTTGMRLSPVELLEKLAALVPLPHVHLVRSAGCLAPHSYRREAIRPTPRQQGADGEQAHVGTPSWPWARLLGRVFGLELATCPWCRRGALRLIAVITQESVITRIVRPLQLAPVPLPIAPARTRQETYAFTSAHAVMWSLRGDVCAGRRLSHMRQDKHGFLLITGRYAAMGARSCWLASR
jgi:hypothetical protein